MHHFRLRDLFYGALGALVPFSVFYACVEGGERIGWTVLVAWLVAGFIALGIRATLKEKKNDR